MHNLSRIVDLSRCQAVYSGIWDSVAWRVMQRVKHIERTPIMEAIPRGYVYMDLIDRKKRDS